MLKTIRATVIMIGECFRMSLSNIRGAKVRSFLTVLGILIGVMAVITLITTVNGVTGSISDSFLSMGAGTLTVSVTGSDLKTGLNAADLAEISALEEVEGVAPTVSIRNARISRGGTYENRITRRLSNDSLEEDLYKYTAICDFRLGDMEAAASIYDRLLRIHPRDSSLMESRATVYAAMGQIQEAVDLFDTAISIDKNNYSRIYNAALTLREYGDEEDGARYLEELLSDHADEIDDLTRGQALCFLGRYEEAEEILGGIANPDLQTTFLLASAREYAGRHEEALALLEGFEDQVAGSPEMLDLKGAALCGIGRYDEGLECFEQALPLSQEGTGLRRSIMFNRIAALENLREFDRAKELAAEYADQYPNDKRMKRENLFLQTR